MEPHEERLHPRGKPGAASEWEKQRPPTPAHGTRPPRAQHGGASAGNLLTSHLHVGFRERTEATRLRRPTKAQVMHRDQGEGRNA